jgi:hypothetical protein
MEEKKFDPSRIEGFKRHRYVRSRGDEGDGCNMQCGLNPLRSSEIEIETSVLCVRADYLSSNYIAHMATVPRSYRAVWYMAAELSPIAWR